LVAVLDKEVIGRISIRHCLNDYLLNFGGHIGFGIIASKRNMGYGSEILKKSIPFALEVGVNEILITCDYDNFASQRVIQKSGGVFEDTRLDPVMNIKKMRCWTHCTNK